MTCREGGGSKNIRDPPNSDMIFLDDMPGSLKVPEERNDSMTILPSRGKTEDYKEKENNIAIDSTNSGRKLLSDSKKKNKLRKRILALQNSVSQ